MCFLAGSGELEGVLGAERPGMKSQIVDLH